MTPEDIEDMISRLHSAMDYRNPYEHLYDWLKEKDPMLFKQWEAIYAIVKSSEEY